MSTESVVNIKQLLSFKELEAGYKVLKRKKKYKDFVISQYPLRYVERSERAENQLKKFLDTKVHTKENRLEFYESLENYKFDPYVAIAIEKGKNTGKFRPLLVPSPKDRLVFDALLPKYYELLHEELSKRKLLGLGLIKKQRISDLVKEMYNIYIKNGYTFALTIDYSAFFSSIDRTLLLSKLELLKGDKELVSILYTLINNQITNGKEVQEKTNIDILDCGIPQGLSFSPLLACFYALEVDDIYLNYPSVIGYRYIDDIVIFGKDEKSLRDVFSKILLKSEELKIKVHPLDVEGSKTELKDLLVSSITFLGVDISETSLAIGSIKFEKFLEIISKEIFTLKVIHQKNTADIKKVYFNFVRGWLNHYEDIVDNPVELHQYLDSIIYDKYFRKQKIRKRFFKSNSWIKITHNTALTE